MLTFHLLKYLKLDNFIKLLFVCKDAGNLCEANIFQDEFFEIQESI